jgi:uncharacterized membrane protein
MNEPVAWALVAVSVLIFAVYEFYVLRLGRTHPDRMARYAHARMRVAWVASVSHQPGFEIVAVQALRNSLMSATIVASTAALALMGTVTLAGSTIESSLANLHTHGISVRLVLEALLMGVLFASYVCSSNAMRYFNHACFVMAMPVGSEQRALWTPLASDYVERAGILYSWGLRTFLMVAPVVAGIVNPYTMPAMTLVLIAVQAWFDRPARIRTPMIRTRQTDHSGVETVPPGGGQ